MRINLIDQNTYDKLLSIYTEFPALNLQNKGYEEINKDELSELERAKHKEVENVLKNTINGFSRFQNFKTRKNGGIALRFQYNYSYEGNGLPFTGVGYILLEELLNGFGETEPNS